MTLGFLTAILARAVGTLQRIGVGHGGIQEVTIGHLRGSRGERKDHVWVHSDSQPFVSVMLFGLRQYKWIMI